MFSPVGLERRQKVFDCWVREKAKEKAKDFFRENFLLQVCHYLGLNNA